MTRQERIAALTAGMQQCKDRDPESIGRALEYGEGGPYAGHCMTIDRDTGRL